MRDAADDESTRAADAFTTVRIERDRVLSLCDQRLVDHIEHFEERHVGKDVVRDVIDQAAWFIRSGLPPDFEIDPHVSFQL